MKAVCKKLFSLMLVAILLVSAVPFQASAEEVDETAAATVAATEAATEAAAEAEITATSPEAYAGEPLVTGKVFVDFQLESETDIYAITANWRVKLVESKLGKSVSAPADPAAWKVLDKAIGKADGYERVRWYYLNAAGEKVTYYSVVLNQDGMTWDTRDVNGDGEDDQVLDVYAEFKTVPTNITLKPNGGTVSTTKHKVELNKSYDAYGGLPTPTRAGYTFLGWFKGDGVQVTNESPVVGLGDLTAKWAVAKCSVEFWNAEGAIDDFYLNGNVDNGTILKTDFSNFPTNADIKAYFQLDGWTIDGWEYSVDGGENWKTFTAGKTKITAPTVIRPLYKKSITLYACDSGNTTRSLTVNLGKPFPTLPHPGTRDGYAFVGWYMEPEASTLVSTKDNLSNVSAHPIVDADVDALYAGWDIAKTVYLYIYTNGETDEHTKLVRYYDVPQTGFDLTDIDLYEIFPNYGKYDDKGDEKYGWYDNAQWKNYCMNKHVNDTTEYIVPGDIEDDVLEFHIMLLDNGNNATSGSTNGTGYNDNKTTVDSSNPSTGDDIFVAVTIMAVSACALVLFFMNKKRIVK